MTTMEQAPLFAETMFDRVPCPVCNGETMVMPDDGRVLPIPCYLRRFKDCCVEGQMSRDDARQFMYFLADVNVPDPGMPWKPYTA